MKWVIAGILTVMLILIFGHDAPQNCEGESKVKEILSLQYRDATIKLENGMVVKVNQATLRPGDMYCFKR